MITSCVAAVLFCTSQALRQSRRLNNTVPASPYTTFNGCTCETTCGAGVGEVCDWCYTKDGCGEWSVSGRWGYCDYRPPTVESWNSQSFQSKMGYYWDSIIVNTTRYPEYPTVSNVFSSMITAFDNYRPEMPTSREKMIHSVGSICKFELRISSSSPYTGLLGPGLQRGFIRMGSASDPGSGGLTPGLGVKLPRTGVPEGGYVMLNSFDAVGWNFFLQNMSNHLAPLSGLSAIVAGKFEEASQCPYQVGISDLARYSQDGTEHNPPRFPFKLMYVPNPDLKTGNGELTLDAVHAELDAIPVGTTLYSIYACAAPAGNELGNPNDLSNCGQPLLLGDLKTSSQCTTSWYGDTRFQIRHQRIEEDWQWEPSFMRQGSYDVDQACGQTVAAEVPASKVCHAEGMLNSDP